MSRESEQPARAPAASSLDIRLATPADAAAACLVVRRSISELCVADHANDTAALGAWLANKTVDMFERLITDARRFSVVVVRDSVVCGFGAMTTAGEIELLYVSPEVRFAGASTSILKALEANAQARGLATITLNSSQTARRFYASRGYVAAGEPVVGIGVTLAWPMAKRLGAGVNIEYRSGADAFDPVAFLRLAERVWNRQLDDGATAAAISRTQNIGAWSDGRLVGAVRVLSDGYLFNTVPEVMVDPDFRRLGIGRELMRRALASAPGGRLFFGAQPGNEGFFERCGFVRGPVGFVGRAGG